MRVIYTAHGFHFYKNAGLLKWMCFYPVERYLARWTDALLTINKEDYNRAKKWIDKQKVYYIPGVGIGLENENIGSEKIREEFGIKKDDILYVSVGELTKRKNHVVVINAICNMVKKQKNIYYLICGSGKLEGKLKNKIEKMGLEKNVILTGYRTDVESILAAADVFVFPSHQEGLPVALLEAMKMGLPVVCSKIRGNVDLIKDGEGGYLVKDRKTESQYEKKMETLYRNETLRKKMGKINRKNIKKYEISQVEKRMKTVYRNIEESWMEEWEKY